MVRKKNTRAKECAPDIEDANKLKEAVERMVAAYTIFPISERAINKRLDAIAAKAEVKRRITVHGLRSFAIDNAFEIFQGDVEKVNRFVGWAPGSEMGMEYKNDWSYRKSLIETDEKGD